MRYKFPCGCSFKILEESNDPDILPKLDLNIDEIEFDCEATWDILGRGLTKGVFQLESQLGKQWTKRLKPEHIEHLAALGAILRPGVLRSIDEKEKCSLTELFCRRKNREAEVEYIHESVRDILKPTFGVLCYQEQAMQIAQVVAGFNLQQADELRKAIGKKLAEEMAKVKVKFFEGANKLRVVSEEQAAEIFGWIEKSQRYSFNRSHAVSYGINGYMSAYLKAHFPVQFYTGWLYYAKDKSDPQQEVRELVNDAKILDVEILPPDILTLEPHFSTNGKIITFGLSNIKGIGENQVVKLKEAVHNVSKLLGKHMNQWTWYEFLVHLTPLLSTTVVERIISVGGLRHISKNRNKMIAEYKTWENLTRAEQSWIMVRSLDEFSKEMLTLKENQEDEIFLEKYDYYSEIAKMGIAAAMELPRFTNFIDALKALAPVKKEGGGTSRVTRKTAVESMASLLEKPPTPLEDTPNWIAWTEENLLGIPLTCTIIDSCDISISNCTCKEYLSGRTGMMVFAVKVESARVITTKKGKSAGSKMAFLTVSDSTCAVDMVCFPQAWSEYGTLLNEGNTVAIQAKRDKNNKDSLIIEKVYQI